MGSVAVDALFRSWFVAREGLEAFEMESRSR